MIEKTTSFSGGICDRLRQTIYQPKGRSSRQQFSRVKIHLNSELSLSWFRCENTQAIEKISTNHQIIYHDVIITIIRSKKGLYQHRPQIAKNNFCVLKGTTSTPPKLFVIPPPTTAHYNGTQQWHHIQSSKVGHYPPPPTKTHCNGTQQWHHIHSRKVGRHPPPNHNTLQWHPATAPSNGTRSTQP